MSDTGPIASTDLMRCTDAASNIPYRPIVELTHWLLFFDLPLFYLIFLQVISVFVWKVNLEYELCVYPVLCTLCKMYFGGSVPILIGSCTLSLFFLCFFVTLIEFIFDSIIICYTFISYTFLGNCTKSVISMLPTLFQKYIIVHQSQIKNTISPKPKKNHR